MKSKTLTPKWGWNWLWMGALVLAACGVSQVPVKDEVREDTVSAMTSGGGTPEPEPTWALPTFAAGVALATDGTQFLAHRQHRGQPGSGARHRLRPPQLPRGLARHHRPAGPPRCPRGDR